MTEREAKRLERLIHQEAPTLTVSAREIGNGEWVCMLNASVWIWDEEDWEKCKHHPDIQAKCLIA